ncbi:MAG TPA: hypothetical protein VEI97_06020, partial [bacterium]|nr:hypothetical protein [bacterium]
MAMKIWMATLLAAGVLLTGCGDDSLDLLDPNDYPLNPATPREGAQGTADWAAVLVDAAEKTAALVADQDVDVT